MMKALIKLMVISCFVVASTASPAFAQQADGPLSITKVRTGWNTDAFAIETGRAIINPAGCPNPNGYHSISSNPGYKTYYAAALMGFSLGKPVTVVVSDTECANDGPKILGIYVGN